MLQPLCILVYTYLRSIGSSRSIGSPVHISLHLILEVLVLQGVLVPLIEVLVLQHIILEVLVLLLDTIHRCKGRFDRVQDP